MNEVKNIKIVINLKDKEFTLTTEQAKELREILDNLLGPHYYYPYVYYYPNVWYGSYFTVTNHAGEITYPDGSKEYFPQGDSIPEVTYTVSLN